MRCYRFSFSKVCASRAEYVAFVPQNLTHLNSPMCDFEKLDVCQFVKTSFKFGFPKACLEKLDSFSNVCVLYGTCIAFAKAKMQAKPRKGVPWCS